MSACGEAPENRTMLRRNDLVEHGIEHRSDLQLDRIVSYKTVDQRRKDLVALIVRVLSRTVSRAAITVLPDAGLGACAGDTSVTDAAESYTAGAPPINRLKVIRSASSMMPL